MILFASLLLNDVDSRQEPPRVLRDDVVPARPGARSRHALLKVQPHVLRLGQLRLYLPGVRDEVAHGHRALVRVNELFGVADLRGGVEDPHLLAVDDGGGLSPPAVAADAGAAGVDADAERPVAGEASRVRQGSWEVAHADVLDIVRELVHLVDVGLPAQDARELLDLWGLAEGVPERVAHRCDERVRFLAVSLVLDVVLHPHELYPDLVHGARELAQVLRRAKRVGKEEMFMALKTAT